MKQAEQAQQETLTPVPLTEDEARYRALRP